MLKTIEDPASVKWSVSGVVTEFSGRNFLLIHRAVYKAVRRQLLRRSILSTDAAGS